MCATATRWCSYPSTTLLFTGLAPFDKDYYRWFLAVDPTAAWRFYYSRQKPQVLIVRLPAADARQARRACS